MTAPIEILDRGFVGQAARLVGDLRAYPLTGLIRAATGAEVNHWSADRGGILRHGAVVVLVEASGHELEAETFAPGQHVGRAGARRERFRAVAGEQALLGSPAADAWLDAILTGIAHTPIVRELPVLALVDPSALAAAEIDPGTAVQDYLTELARRTSALVLLVSDVDGFEVLGRGAPAVWPLEQRPSSTDAQPHRQFLYESGVAASGAREET